MEENQPQKPTREQIRSNNRETRLGKGWANVCPVPTCKRKFTSRTGFLAHLENYHKIKVNERPAAPAESAESAPEAIEPMPETQPEATGATEAPCCPEGERYERETGAHGDDHPGDCTESTEKSSTESESIKKD